MRRIRTVMLAAFLLLVFATESRAQAADLHFSAVAQPAQTSPAEQPLLSYPARLQVEEVALAKALVELQERSGVHLAFSRTMLPAELRVSCNCLSATVEQALHRLLAPTGFRITDLGPQILIEPGALVNDRPSNPTQLDPLRLQYAPSNLLPVTTRRTDRNAVGTITGTAVDATTQRPLNGVQVFVSELSIGTLTASNGRYTLLNVPPGPVTVQAQMIGYMGVQQQVTVQDGQSVTLDLQLEPQALSLDEVVVTGTGGSARVREMGTAISRLDSREIENIPVARPQDILAGRVAGVAVNQGGGQPSNEGGIRLRGNNSVSQGNQPLIYVDGIRIYSEHTPTGSGTSSGSLGLNSISPNDIERIEIVKGAAASTLYGTEAAGGVIQIFTKQGFSGSPQWQAEVGLGISRVDHYGPNWNKEDNPTGLYMNECRGSNVLDYLGEQIDDVTCPESGSWIQTGEIQNYSLSVRGGAGDVTYYLAANLNSEGSTAPQGWGRRGGFRGNVSFQPRDNLQLTWNNAYTRGINRFLPEGGGIQSFIGQATRGPGITYRIDGEPAAGLLLKNQLYDWKDHYVTGFTVDYDQMENLSHRFTTGFDYNLLTGQDLYEFGNGRYPLGQIDARDWRNTVLSLDYSGSFSIGSIDRITSSLTWGGQYFHNSNRQVNSSSVDFAGPGDPTLSSGARREVTETRARVVNAGLFIQETLGFADRLFLVGGLRFDGNSAFGKDFGIQMYPKLSGSYVISDHEFWPTNLIQSMRLRAAMGESGKAPGAFDAVRVWDPIAADDGQPGFTPSRLGNSNLGPERTREYEMGFEASALDDRLSLEFTWYRQHVMDALVPVQPPPSQGFLSTQLENIGELVNRGIELSAEAALIRTSSIDWTTRLNISTTNTEAIDLGGQRIPLGSQNEVLEGHPVPVFVGSKVMNPDEFADPILAEDQVLGQVYPDRTIGLGTSVTFLRNLTLDAQGEFVYGGHNMYPQGEINARRLAFPPCFEIQRKFEAREAGDPSALDGVSAIWRARCGNAFNGEYARYDMWTGSSDFFRLRTVSLNYQLPAGVIPGTTSANLSLAGRNLYTSTDWFGVDPEENNSNASSLERRGWSSWPTPHSFLVTLRVGF
ncbi:MAG: SusC/RagA family TonB-linked outer membrane protein [Gemmatimonas sp.]|nr:SusC/RagA family TonB-linked outer membrane protein [Gemmatimonas sp.]